MTKNLDAKKSVELRHRLQGASPGTLTWSGVAVVWSASILIHAAALGGIASMGTGSGKGLGRPQTLEVGLVDRDEGGESAVFDAPEAQAAEPQPGLDEGDPRAAELVEPTSNSRLDALPEPNLDRRLLATAGTTLREANQALAPTKRLDGGKARTKFFDVEATGKSFVWVIDRSASMSHRFALELAKREVEKSLATLGPNHLFQMFFYHTTFERLPSAGGTLLPATKEQVELARRFVRKMLPQGGTEHNEPLLEAIRLGPEVIYFLTDADMMTDRDVSQLTAANRQSRRPAVIHTIEFGNGPNVHDDKPLRRLARENEGTYMYVDVRQASIPSANPPR